MADIKIKEKNKGIIKTIDKSIIATQRIKDSTVRTKNLTENIYNDFRIDSSSDNEIEYGNTKIQNMARTIKNKSVLELDRYGKKAAQYTNNNLIKMKSQMNNYKIRQAEKRVNKKINNDIKKTVKETTKTIKGYNNASQKFIKTANNTRIPIKKNIESAQKNAIKIRETIKNITEVARKSIVAVTNAIKAIIMATNKMVAFLVAGGWIAFTIIIVVCLIGLLLGSVFGIFFSGADVNHNSKTMNTAIQEINKDFINKITQIQNENAHDEYDIESDRAEWKNILAVYAVKVGSGDEEQEVVTIDDNKMEKLRNIFWDMNEVTYNTEAVEKEVQYIDEKGNITSKKEEVTVLHIKINNKKPTELASKYNFSNEQKKQLDELLQNEYLKVWNQAIYGISNGSNEIVSVALSQVGNVGGQPYWSWYGFSSRVEWCATFVSWCANECGYIETGVIPKFAACQSEGVKWFQTCGLWKDGGYIPNPGDIIFFDWKDKHDGHSDHVGIVEKVENGRVYTIEGNSHNSCKQNNYDLNSFEIQGYGTPIY